MKQTITFFDTTKDLETLTGLTTDKLGSAGFDLDDMDFGFVAEKEWNQDGWDDDDPCYESWLLYRMGSYCMGYKHTEFNGRHYYILYRS